MKLHRARILHRFEWLIHRFGASTSCKERWQKSRSIGVGPGHLSIGRDLLHSLQYHSRGRSSLHRIEPKFRNSNTSPEHMNRLGTLLNRPSRRLVPWKMSRPANTNESTRCSDTPRRQCLGSVFRTHIAPLARRNVLGSPCTNGYILIEPSQLRRTRYRQSLNIHL